MPPVVHLQAAAGKGRAPPDEVSTGSAADFIPPNPTFAKLRKAATGCRGCRLWTIGTQTVFGESPETARVLIVGEQPGDAEDREGRPFVGPAGRLLDSALEGAGIDRGEVYVTNAVKHFKWEKREGTKRRIHKKPGDRESAQREFFADLREVGQYLRGGRAADREIARSVTAAADKAPAKVVRPSAGRSRKRPVRRRRG